MLADPRAENLARNFTGQWLQARDVEGIASNPREIIMRDAGEEAVARASCARPGSDAGRSHRASGSPDYIDSHRGCRSPSSTTTCARRCAAKPRNIFAYVDRAKTVRSPSSSTATTPSSTTSSPSSMASRMSPARRCARSRCRPAARAAAVLTQGSALLVTSNPDRTSPVKRGLFVLANFLGTPPPPPPANVPALEASEGEFKGHEPRAARRAQGASRKPACASCHNRMDPIGLAFENFNALGMWRDSERKQPIAAARQPDYRRNLQQRGGTQAYSA